MSEHEARRKADDDRESPFIHPELSRMWLLIDGINKRLNELDTPRVMADGMAAEQARVQQSVQPHFHRLGHGVTKGEAECYDVGFRAGHEECKRHYTSKQNEELDKTRRDLGDANQALAKWRAEAVRLGAQAEAHARVIKSLQDEKVALIAQVEDTNFGPGSPNGRGM